MDRLSPLSKALKSSFVLGAIIPLCTALMVGCAEDNINKVKNGYFPNESKKNVSEVLSLSPYAAKGSWSNLEAKGEVPMVAYRSTIANEIIVNWAMPNLSEELKTKVVKNLNDKDFEVSLNLEFAVYKNGSFEVEDAFLAYQDTKTAQNSSAELIDRLIAKEGLSDFNLADKSKVLFNEALYDVLLANTNFSEGTKVGLFGHPGSLFSRTIFSDKEIYRSFHPLSMNRVQELSLNKEQHSIHLKANTQILDLNDYMLNEIGLTIFENGYGLLDGSKLKSDQEILKLITPYSYNYLLSQELSFDYDFTKLSLGEDCKIESLDQEVLTLSDSDSNKAYLASEQGQLKLSFDSNYQNNSTLRDYVIEQQNIIDYTAIAYPIAYAASSIASFTSKQSDYDLFKAMIGIRNKVMNEAGAKIPKPLSKGQSI